MVSIRRPECLARGTHLETTLHEDGGTVDGSSRHNDGLLGADDGELSVDALDESTDAATTRRRGSEVGEGGRGRRGGRGGCSEEEALDVRVGEELGAVERSVLEPADGSRLLLRVGASERAESTRVGSSASVLLRDVAA